MEFLHLYINNCIQRCRDTADKNMQNRYVRLVSSYYDEHANLWSTMIMIGVCVPTIFDQKQGHQYTGIEADTLDWNFILGTLQTLKEEYVEIHAFCLEYSKIKEAAALYRLVKTMEAEGAPTYPWQQSL